MTVKARRSRRRWSEEFKRRVAVEAAAPGSSAAAVARRYDLNANLLFNWKRRYGMSDRFLPVEIREPSPSGAEASDRPTAPGHSEISSIEIALVNGRRIAVTGRLDSATLCRLLRLLGGP